MPTVLQNGPYRFFFYSGDRNEPLHIHVERDNNKAKFWLDPIRLANSIGFPRHELRLIEKLIIEDVTYILRSWDEHFND